MNIQYTKKLQDIAKSVPGGKTDNIKHTNEGRLCVNNLRLYLKIPIKKNQKKQMKSKASRKKKMQEQKSMKQKLEKQNETKKPKIRFFININKID